MVIASLPKGTGRNENEGEEKVRSGQVRAGLKKTHIYYVIINRSDQAILMK